jgi:hypothetical protein
LVQPGYVTKITQPLKEFEKMSFRGFIFPGSVYIIIITTTRKRLKMFVILMNKDTVIDACFDAPTAKQTVKELRANEFEMNDVPRSAMTKAEIKSINDRYTYVRVESDADLVNYKKGY